MGIASGEFAYGLSQRTRAAEAARGVAEAAARPRPSDRIAGRRGPEKSPSSPPADPPRPPRRYVGWVLIGLLLAGAIPLLAGLHRDVGIGERESEAIAVADETWRRQSILRADGWTLERLVPVRDAEPVLDRPPGLTWMHVLAFSSMNERTTPNTELVYRARLVSVAMSLIALGAVFWAGMSVGGLRCATLAGLVFVANPLMVLHGRMATADAATVGWAMFSIAAALWAMRPLRPAPPLLRQALGWGICGLALGAATLTRGPAVIAPVLLPLLLIGMMGQRRIAYAFGLCAAGFLGALISIPWAIYVQQREPGAWEQWVAMLQPTMGLPLAGIVAERALTLLVGSGVWSLLVIAALLLPWAVVDRPERRRALIVWVWAVAAVLIVLTGPVLSGMDAAGGTAGALLAVPVLALAVGQLLRMVGDLALQGRLSRTWKAVRLPTAGLVLALSLAGPILLYLRIPQVSGLGVPGAPGAPGAGVGVGYWVLAGLGLTLLGVLGAKWATRPFPGRAVACWSVWTVVAMTLVMWPHAHGSADRPAARQSFEKLEQRLEDSQSQWHRPRPSPRVSTARAGA